MGKIRVDYLQSSWCISAAARTSLPLWLSDIIG